MINFKENNKSYIFGLLLASAILTPITSCSKEDDADNAATTTNYSLCLEQAHGIWSKLNPSCTVTSGKIMSDGKAFTYNLNLAYTTGMASKEDVSAKLVIDTDTLKQAVAKVGTSSAYDIYKDAQVVPDGMYTLSATELTLQKNRTRSDGATLTVNTDKLLEQLHAEGKADGTYVLPVRIKEASAHSINGNEDIVMFVFNIHDAKSEAAFNPDGEGVPDDDKLEDGYKLLWHDEFNGKGAPDPDKWRCEEGFQRNEEDQWYSANNVEMKGNELVFTARQEKVKNPNYNPNATGGNSWKKTREYADYTSACIVSTSKYVFKYGRVLVRAKVPVQQGAWPAIWSTGNRYEWPLNGEIDIMEFYKEKIHANVCWGGNSRWNGSWNSKNYKLADFVSKDPYWAEKYHIWRMDWDEKYLRIYLDDELLNETDLSTTWNKGDHGAGAGGNINPYSNDMQDFGQLMMLNLAIGGINGRPIQAKFPFTYNVDYVRVYQKSTSGN